MITYTRGSWWHIVAGLWISQALVIISSNALNFALIWQLTAQTASAQALGWAAALSLLPGVVLTPFAGVISDRMPRQRMMMAAEFVSAVPLLWLMTTPEPVPVWSIYVLVVWRAIATAGHQTAFQAMLPQLIPPQHLQRLSGTQQLVMGLSSFATPLLGAVIVSTYGVAWATQWVLLALLISIVFLVVVRFPTLSDAQVVTRWQDDLLAVRQIFRQRRGLVSLLWAAVILNMCLLPVFSLLPFVVNVYFAAGPWLLAWFELSGGVGLVAGAVLLAVWGGFRHVPHTLMVAVTVLLLAMVCIAVTPPQWPWLIMVAMGLIGWAAAWAHGPLVTLVQYNVPPQMHGRALALLQTAMNAAAPLGIVVSSSVVEFIGIRSWAGVAASVVAVVLIIAVRGPIMQLRSEPLPRP